MTYGEDVAVPNSWRVEYKVDNTWKTMKLYITDSYQKEPNKFNVVHPASVINADAIKIWIEPQRDKAVGISEINID